MVIQIYVAMLFERTLQEQASSITETHCIYMNIKSQKGNNTKGLPYRLEWDVKL